MIQAHVTNLELSKRLKELGVPQKSIYFHTPEGSIVQALAEHEPWDFWVSAFLSSELGELLPQNTRRWYSYLENGNFKWRCQHIDGSLYCYICGAETEADARAKMLIYLIEQGLVKP